MNEKQCINKVIRFLEISLSERCINCTSPEKDPSCPIDARIDQAFTIGERRFALEHTLIEPFEGSVRVEKATRDLELNLANKGSGVFRAPFDIYLPVNWMDGFSRNKGLPQFADAIIELVAKNSQDIKTLRKGSKPLRLGMLENKEIYVKNRFNADAGGGAFVPRVVLWAPNEAGERFRRISRAMEKKIKKLDKWAETHCTVLVLENIDISLTDPQSVLIEIEKYFGETAIPISYLFLIESSHDDGCVFPFIENGVFSARSPDGTLKHMRFDASDLD